MNRIDGPGFGQNKPNVSRSNDSSNTAASNHSTAGAKSASNISATTTFSNVISTANVQPEINVENVARIKEAITQGDYHIDPERVAKAFSELEGFL